MTSLYRENDLSRLVARGAVTKVDATVDAFVGNSKSMGAPGVDEVRWLLPIRPDDELSLRAKVLETRASKSRPDMGFVRFEFELFNAQSQRVMTLVTSLMMGRREGAAS